MSFPAEKQPGFRASGGAAHQSRKVSSAQREPHDRLRHKVELHLNHRWRQPVPAHTRAAFDAVAEMLASFPNVPLVFDSGCGTGRSTRLLADAHADCMIIGIDRSAHRLERGVAAAMPRIEGRCVWVRAELATFWRLAFEANWVVRKNYLLYPNPWPKAAHLGRRWHGHPVFPTLLGLSENVELRTNWRIYAEEFATAVGIAMGARPPVESVNEEKSLSPFEAKYRASGHSLYRVDFTTKKAPANRGFQSAT
jgi:tRNA G46 methylase TrmB